jgi:hypothetical protein
VQIVDRGADLPHESRGLFLRVGSLLHEALEELACSGLGLACSGLGLACSGLGLALGSARRARLQALRVAAWARGAAGWCSCGAAGRRVARARRLASRDELHDDEPLALRLEDVPEGHDVRVAAHAAKDLHLARVRGRVGVGARVRLEVGIRVSQAAEAPHLV